MEEPEERTPFAKDGFDERITFKLIIHQGNGRRGLD